MKRKFLKRNGNAIQERCVKGMRKIQRLIDEANEHNPFVISPDNNERKHSPFAVANINETNPFIDTDEWDELSEEDQKLVDAYLEIFDAEDTLSETLNAASDKFCGQFDSWTEWVQDEYWEGGGYITSEDLVDEGCVDWEKAGKIFSKDYEMTQTGMVFRIAD